MAMTCSRQTYLVFLAAALAAGACTLTPQPTPPLEDVVMDSPADDPADLAWDPSELPDTVSDPPAEGDTFDLPQDVVPDTISDVNVEDVPDVSAEDMLDAVEEDAMEEDVELDEIEEVEDGEELDEIEDIEEIEETEEEDWLEVDGLSP